MSGPAPSPAEPRLVARVAARAVRPVSAHERARARLHLLDWLGCLSGARAEPLFDVARRLSPDPLRRAACLGALLEMDDVDRLGRAHPGPVVWPAALMAARHQSTTIGAILEAGVAGYEAMIAVARMLDDHHYRHCHPTHTAGRFGAAAAAARIAGAGQPGLEHAMAIAGSSAGAYWQVRLSDATSKAFHLADAVLGGVLAADCAIAGMTGPADLLEGPLGLFAALCHAPGPLPAPPGWLLDEVSFKPWPACRHAHPAIDAALALPPGALDRGPIRVATYADALAFCDRPLPRTPADARFSLQHALAVVAARGRPTLADFDEEALEDTTLAAVRARVSCSVDPALDAAYPAHYGARVEAGGASALVRDAWGDPEHPVDDAALIAKLKMLVAWGGLPANEAEAAIAIAFAAPDDQGPDDLMALLDRWLA
ncbi:MmgE/PrpD family protein [Thermaurantiacus sp.]